MAKIDKLLQEMMESEMFSRFVKHVARIWHDETPAPAPIIKTVDRVIEKPVDRIVERLVERKVVQEVTPAWAKMFESYQDLLQQVRQHPRLAAVLLGDAPANEQVVRLLVCGAQWSNILRLWDVLADQVKESREEVSPAELHILHACLNLFNMTLGDYKASLQAVDMTLPFDSAQHQRASISGERIQVVLLQGLINAADEVVRSAVVLTN